jgi:hypothetical protein
MSYKPRVVRANSCSTVGNSYELFRTRRMFPVFARPGEHLRNVGGPMKLLIGVSWGSDGTGIPRNKSGWQSWFRQEQHCPNG